MAFEGQRLLKNCRSDTFFRAAVLLRALCYYLVDTVLIIDLVRTTTYY